MRRNLLPAALLVLVSAPLAAQSTGTPVFHGPYRVFDRYEFGANISDAGNLAVEGFYGFSHTGAKWDFALRGGVLDTGGDQTVVLIGVDAGIGSSIKLRTSPRRALITGVGAQLCPAGRLADPDRPFPGRRSIRGLDGQPFPMRAVNRPNSAAAQRCPRASVAPISDHAVRAPPARHGDIENSRRFLHRR